MMIALNQRPFKTKFMYKCVHLKPRDRTLVTRSFECLRNRVHVLLREPFAQKQLHFKRDHDSLKHL